MSKVNESTVIMKNGFMEDWQNKIPISEIAKKYGVSKKTVYLHLGEIAKEAGVSRESLLTSPKPDGMPGSSNRKPSVRPPGPKEFHEHLNHVLSGIGKMKETVQKELVYQEDLETLQDEEEK